MLIRVGARVVRDTHLGRPKGSIMQLPYCSVGNIVVSGVRQGDETVTWMPAFNHTFTSGGSYVSECVTKVKVEPAGQPAHDLLLAISFSVVFLFRGSSYRGTERIRTVHVSA